MFDPVAHAMNLVQTSGMTLGEAVQIWIDLLAKFHNDDNKKLLVEEVNIRWNVPSLWW